MVTYFDCIQSAATFNLTGAGVDVDVGIVGCGVEWVVLSLNAHVLEHNQR